MYDDAGNYLGEVMETEDGGYALVGEDGEIVAAVDADLEEVDPAGYELVGGEDDYEDDPYDLAGRMDELEQRMAEAPPPVDRDRFARTCESRPTTSSGRRISGISPTSTSAPSDR